MPIVRVKEKYQVTIPSEVREHLSVGDFLEASVEDNGVITFTPKSFIDRRIAEALDDIRAGREHGPYASVKAAKAAFDERGRRTSQESVKRSKK